MLFPMTSRVSLMMNQTFGYKYTYHLSSTTRCLCFSMSMISVNNLRNYPIDLRHAGTHKPRSRNVSDTHVVGVPKNIIHPNLVPIAREVVIEAHAARHFDPNAQSASAWWFRYFHFFRLQPKSLLWHDFNGVTTISVKF